MMKIVIDFPPNMKQVLEAFDLGDMRPVFAWGDTLYNPFNGVVDDALMAHEETHSRQQAKFGVEAWWKRYLRDADFRLAMEIEAYQNQYAHASGVVRDRNQLARYLQKLAMTLASPMYGNIITLSEARRAIVDKSIRFDVPLPDSVV